MRNIAACAASVIFAIMRRIRRVAVAVLLCVASDASADGEATPMLGGSVVWTPTSERPSGMAGFLVEASWWYGRVGLAAEGAGLTFVDGDHARAWSLGGSLRVRLYDRLVPSLLDPRDVEVGVELQGIALRQWWERGDSDANGRRLGVGLAIRVRGGTDDGTTRMSESRFFFRIMATPAVADAMLARTTMPVVADEPRELILLLGIGAAFGGGDPDYLKRF